MKFRTARKLNYLKKAHHRHGHGIHSPWLFRLITNVIENKKRLPEYKILRDQRDRLSRLIKGNKDQTELQIIGAAILKLSGRKNLFKAVELPFKYGKLVLRLVNEFKPESILYIGPTFGLNLLYLALSNNRSSVDFFHPGDYLKQVCRQTLEEAKIMNVRFHEEEEPVGVNHDFIFINAPFEPELVERLTRDMIASGTDYEVLIIRGIHDSERMESIWKNWIRQSRIKVSLDLFEFGIVIFSDKLQKENFVLKF
jgi:hypothetical protein